MIGYLWGAIRGPIDAERAINLAFERTLDLKREAHALHVVNTILVSFLQRQKVIDPAEFASYVDKLSFKGLDPAVEMKVRERIASLKTEASANRGFQVIKGGRSAD
jgi:hypothetical protein